MTPGISGDAPTQGNVEHLFEAAHRDPELKRKLLADPVGVAKEWNVELAKEDVDRLARLGSFVELTDEVRLGSLYRRCNPLVCYPSSVWLVAKIEELIGYLIRYPVDPIFYPGPEYIKYKALIQRQIHAQLERRLSMEIGRPR